MYKMHDKNYNIGKQKFFDIYEKVEEVFCNICLMQLFCERYYNVDDFGKIKPIMKYTVNTADKLYCELINIRNFYTF